MIKLIATISFPDQNIQFSSIVFRNDVDFLNRVHKSNYNWRLAEII